MDGQHRRGGNVHRCDGKVVEHGATAVAKVPSTPDDPARGLAAAVAELAAQGVDADGITLVAHGTTIATNAMLTGQLGKVALVATAGLPRHPRLPRRIPS